MKKFRKFFIEIIISKKAPTKWISLIIFFNLLSISFNFLFSLLFITHDPKKIKSINIGLLRCRISFAISFLSNWNRHRFSIDIRPTRAHSHSKIDDDSSISRPFFFRLSDSTRCQSCPKLAASSKRFIYWRSK